jgi:hypothetical protein
MSSEPPLVRINPEGAAGDGVVLDAGRHADLLEGFEVVERDAEDVAGVFARGAGREGAPEVEASAPDAPQLGGVDQDRRVGLRDGLEDFGQHSRPTRLRPG